jgi:uncharacterized protein YgiM (DUF1202 family)
VKKAKIVSILIIMFCVVALGVFMGKQIFKLIEAGSTETTSSNTATSTVQILYSSTQDETTNEVIPQPEVSDIGQATATPDARQHQAATTDTQPITETSAPSFSADGPKWFAYASGNGINVRNGPSTSYEQLFKVAKGTRGTVVEKKNGWTRIKWDFNRKIGWVRDDLLVQGPADIVSTLVQKTGDVEEIDVKQITKANAKKVLKENKMIVAAAKKSPVEVTVQSFVEGNELPENAKISANPFANIRTGPGTQNARITKLPKGLVVKINKAQREGKWLWFEITFNEGKKTGWTREDNLTF